jgi:micrococcal nuclease
MKTVLSTAIMAILLLIMPGTLAAGELCGRATVHRVIDGDTIRVGCDGREFTVRLIGIDAPETHHPRKPVQCFGRKSSEYLRGRIEGRRVRLEYDVQKTGKYGRTLAYVYRGRTMVNAEMVKKGYAFAIRYYPYRYRGKFLKYEGRAKEGRRGLWGACESRE